jgi:hypothetical protein
MRRWVQFSLRGFLIAVTVACLLLGWKVERARRRGRSVDVIAEHGCEVRYYLGSSVFTVGKGHNPFDHFWADFRAVSVSIFFAEAAWSKQDRAALNCDVISHVHEIDNVDHLAYGIPNLEPDEVPMGYELTMEKRKQFLEKVFPHLSAELSLPGF